MIRIYDAGARLNDAAAMGALLEPVPGADELRSKLESGFRGCMCLYNLETRKAFWVACDGSIALVFTVTEVTPKDAALIEFECRDVGVWSRQAFTDAVGRALGEECVTPQ